MSAPVSSNDKLPSDTSDRSATDIFKGLNDSLHDGDPFDSLDLTKPLPKDKEEKSKEEIEEEEVEEEEVEDEIEEEPEEELDELGEIEEDLAEPTDEQLELDTEPIRRRDILKKYPKIFKEFPAVEKAIYREREFTKLLPTIKDAQTAVENSKLLESYADDMIEKGNTFNVLKMIKDNNPETFARVADNYLEHLAQVDEGAYRHVLSNVIKNTVVGMVQAAKESGEEDLRIAAGLLYKYVFNSTKFEPPKKLAKEESDKKTANPIEEREKAFVKHQLETATADIDGRVRGTIKAAVEKYIDPNGSMTDYLKRNAVKDAIEKITGLIERDSRFTKLNEKLWDKMIQSNFSKASQDEIAKAYFARAKSLLAPVLRVARSEALKGMGKKAKNESVDDNDKNDKDEKPVRQRTERRLSSDKTKPNLDAIKGMSSHEALNALMGD